MCSRCTDSAVFGGASLPGQLSRVSCSTPRRAWQMWGERKAFLGALPRSGMAIVQQTRHKWGFTIPQALSLPKWIPGCNVCCNVNGEQQARGKEEGERRKRKSSREAGRPGIQSLLKTAKSVCVPATRSPRISHALHPLDQLQHTVDSMPNAG